ncbi:MAG: hypothetical protein L0196_02085 [candidate division Zixibacteria bacterium]|nr:hypothetical protein [candidate division Zixibacteria bacterium]
MALRLLILSAVIFAACGKKKPDAAQQVRAFLADWERAVDAKNPAVLDSLLTTVENTTPIDPQKFLAEIYNSTGVTRVDLVGRQLDIGERQAAVTGRLVRSGVSDSLATLNLTLLRTKRGWKLAAYRFAPFAPVKKDTANTETVL